jgi:hypothetical protein
MSSSLKIDVFEVNLSDRSFLSTKDLFITNSFGWVLGDCLNEESPSRKDIFKTYEVVS